jgi:alkanesulfonate monooxygenase SsuD/methylene tetrahydromethanopterin reductase-like flavin-dependent oxidoreductase (luciferase family)
MLDEACQIIKRMWTEDSVDHDGRFWKLTGALCNPKPVQTKIPLVVGGSGERKTLRVVAKHADEWNFPAAMGAGPDDFARLSGVLDEHCAAIGRDSGEIRRSVQLFIDPEQPEQAKLQLDQLEVYEKAGADHAVLSFYSPPSKELLRSVAP